MIFAKQKFHAIQKLVLSYFGKKAPYYQRKNLHNRNRYRKQPS